MDRAVILVRLAAMFEFRQIKNQPVIASWRDQGFELRRLDQLADQILDSGQV
ncbi:MAG: hypothetical protein Q8K12_01865 [Thiobacillus sp.]|nr:hypothetical protein [Thiobacillus sp.]